MVTDRHNILFDSGQSNLLIHQAALLGADLGKVDLAVLSHGHYDHGGGLEGFLEVNKTAPVYLHKTGLSIPATKLKSTMRLPCAPAPVKRRYTQ